MSVLSLYKITLNNIVDNKKYLGMFQRKILNNTRRKVGLNSYDCKYSDSTINKSFKTNVWTIQKYSLP